MVITWVFRLAISFVKALLWRILAEVGKELKTLCLQMSQASSSFEFMVVEALEGLFGGQEFVEPQPTWTIANPPTAASSIQLVGGPPHPPTLFIG